jgi:hypothetical protein
MNTDDLVPSCNNSTGDAVPLVFDFFDRLRLLLPPLVAAEDEDGELSPSSPSLIMLLSLSFTLKPFDVVAGKPAAASILLLSVFALSSILIGSRFCSCSKVSVVLSPPGSVLPPVVPIRDGGSLRAVILVELLL